MVSWASVSMPGPKPSSPIGEVAARTHVTLYEHAWYQGNWYDFDNTSWNDYWYNVEGWFNDQASSFVSGNY